MSSSYLQPVVGDYCDHADTCVGPGGTMYILASQNKDLVLLRYAPGGQQPITIVLSFIESFSSQFEGFCKFGLGASIAIDKNTLYCYVPVETGCGPNQSGEQTCLYLIEVPL